VPVELVRGLVPAEHDHEVGLFRVERGDIRDGCIHHANVVAAPPQQGFEVAEVDVRVVLDDEGTPGGRGRQSLPLITIASVGGNSPRSWYTSGSMKMTRA